MMFEWSNIIVVKKKSRVTLFTLGKRFSSKLISNLAEDPTLLLWQGHPLYLVGIWTQDLSALKQVLSQLS